MHTEEQQPDDDAPEIRRFEDFARRAIELGFTVHLTHYRFHPAHLAWATSCRPGVELFLAPILQHTKEQFGDCRTFKNDTISAMLEQGQQLIDRYAAGENLAAECPPPRRRGRPPRHKPEQVEEAKA